MSKQNQDPDCLVYQYLNNPRQSYEMMYSLLKKGQWNVSEQIQQICQSVMWGDKHNDTFFDYFCDQNTIQIYYNIIKDANFQQRDVVVAVIKSLTMLLQNILKDTSINYILSHPAFNKFITADYNFQDDEILAYYINLLKCVSIRVGAGNLQLFFNLKFSTFPMLMRAISFYGHRENLIRTSVRNIVLGITKIQQQTQLRRYVSNFPFVLFYVQFNSYFKEQFFLIDDGIKDGKFTQQKMIKLMLDDQLDILYFQEDLLKLNNDSIKVIINAMFAYGFFPILEQIKTCNIKFFLYTLIQVYKSFTFPEFLDLLTYILLSKDSIIQDYLRKNDSKLYVTQSHSSVWENQTEFISTYAQYVYKNGCISYSDDVIQSIKQTQQEEDFSSSEFMQWFFKSMLKDDQIYTKEQLSSDITSITQILDLQLIKAEHHENKSPLNLMNLIGKGGEQQDGTFYHQLIKQFDSQDDTVIFMLLLFFKTLRHSKSISHNILKQVGLITPDKDMNLYKECAQIRSIYIDYLLNILRLGSPPYRLGTLFLACSMFLDLNRVNLEEFHFEKKNEFRDIIISQIEKVRKNMDQTGDLQFTIDFFLNEYKVFNKNTVSIWPQAHSQLLFPMSAPGVCQIDSKHPENSYFIEPTQHQDKVRRDLVVLLLYKYVGEIIFKFSEESLKILNNPTPISVKQNTYEVGQQLDVREQEYANRRVHKCKLRMNGQEYEQCAVMEDEQNLLIIDKEEKGYKLLVCYNLKYTDEIIEKLNLKIMHISFKNKNVMANVDLEFSNKFECQDAKKMIEKEKQAIRKHEVSSIELFLSTLEKVIN